MKSMLVFVAFFTFLGVAKPASIMSTSDRAVKPTSECQICEYVMKFIRFQTVNQAQSVGAVKQKLEALFKLVPPSRQHDEYLSMNYLSNIEEHVRMFRDGMDPQSICKVLSKCSTVQLEVPHDAPCDACTIIVDLIYYGVKVLLEVINQVIEVLEEILSPDDICELLGFCNKTVPTLTSNYVKALLQLALSKNSSSTLRDLCMMVFSTTNSELKDLEGNLDKVENMFNDVCDALEDMAQQHDEYLSMKYLSNIEERVKMIRDGMDPQSIWKLLTKGSTVQLKVPHIAPCEVCTVVVGYVYNGIKLFLAVIKEVVELLEKILSADNICDLLGFCSYTVPTLTSNYVKALMQLALSKNSSSTLCDLCMMVFSTTDSEPKDLENNLDKVENMLNDVCEALGDMAQQCKSVVDVIFIEIKTNDEYIKNKLDGSTACMALHFCPESLN